MLRTVPLLAPQHSHCALPCTPHLEADDGIVELHCLRQERGANGRLLIIKELAAAKPDDEARFAHG
jgi:hypothetical protein